MNVRWVNKDKLPIDVSSAMADFLPEALREAAHKDDPGDGSMIILSCEVKLGNGMYDGGWLLQATFVHDIRLNPKPFVVVHAYSDSQITKGSVAADVEHTAEQLRANATRKLKMLFNQRKVLDQDIAKLLTELGQA